MPLPRRVGIPALLVLAALALMACSGATAASGISQGLLDLDVLLAAGEQNGTSLAAAFNALYSRARSADDWISLAKRAPEAESQGDAGRMLQTATRMRKAFPANENLAQVAAWLYLRDDQPGKALALFPKVLDPGVHADLWAEAVIKLGRESWGIDDSVTAKLALISEDPAWYYEAGLRAMAMGRVSDASTWLGKAGQAGFHVPLEVLWDAGRPADVLSALGRAPSGKRLQLAGDAAWVAGRRDLAVEYWKHARPADADSSWKRDAALAVSSPDSASAISGAQELARTHSAFPSARRYAAAIFLREGRMDLAAPEIAALAASTEPLGLLMALEFKQEGLVEDRSAAAAIRLVEAHPDSGQALDGALRYLLLHGKYEDFLVLEDEAEKMNRTSPDAWFRRMMARVLAGDFEAARQEVVQTVPGEGTASLSLAYATGLLSELTHSPSEARPAYEAALVLARSPGERCAVLKQIGRFVAAVGNQAKAKAAWNAAGEADPEDPEARILATKTP
ncbi:MAG: hypothetical protein ACOYM2_15120 [Rectinemataceae bacterium]